MSVKQNKKLFNPFEGRDREEVWKEIREQARPTTREEALRKIEELSEQKRSNSYSYYLIFMPEFKLPSDFVNPFAAGDPGKIWNDFKRTSRHVSRKEAFNILEKARRAQKKGKPEK